MSVVSLQGSDLRQAVLSGHMPRDAVVPLLTKLALALEGARRQRQARPKLRPRNIRIDQFGDPLQLEGSLLPPAPEESSDATNDERSEVFSLGVTGLFVLHGKDLPLDLFTGLDAFVAGLDCDPALAAVLRRACAWDPDERFATLRDLHDALVAAAPDRGSHPAVGRMTSPDGVDACQLLIRQDPTRLDPYFSLVRLYQAQGEIDKAWCVASTLAFFGRAEGDVLELYERHRQKGPIRPRTTLDEERWVKEVFHPAEDLFIGRLFDAVTSAVVRSRVRPDKAFGLKPEQMVDVEASTVTIARSFGFVARVLGLPTVPRLFLCPDREGGMAYATTTPLASVCGKAVLSGLNPLDLTYLVGKHLSYYRGEHYLRTLFRTSHDAQVLLAAAKRLAGLQAEGDETIDGWVREIEALLGDERRAQLRAVGELLVQSGRRTDVVRWLGAIELTAARVGFLLCGDLAVAARLAAADPMTRAAGLGPEEVIRELVLFSVSEQLFRLREHLGIRVDGA